MLQALAASGLVLPAMPGVPPPGLAGVALPPGLSAPGGFPPGVPPGAAAAALAGAPGGAVDWHAMTALGGMAPVGQQQPQVVMQGGGPPF